MSKYYLNYLDELESEAIYVLREVWAQFQNPVILFSGGKDSILVTYLAKKAFYSSKIPFVLMGKKLTDKQLSDLISKGKTGIIKGFLNPSDQNSLDGKLVLGQGFNVEFEQK